MIPRTLPFPALPHLRGTPDLDALAAELEAYFQLLQTRFNQWIGDVSDAEAQKVLRTVPLTSNGDGTWSCPFTVDTEVDHSVSPTVAYPRALLLSDPVTAGVFQPIPAATVDPPPAGHWFLRQADNAQGALTQRIVLAEPALSIPWFGFLAAAHL